jgi:hypothetical protein
MKKQRYKSVAILSAITLAVGCSGCAGLGRGASEVGLAGAGGAIGYAASDHKVGGAAAGAAVGYIAAKVAERGVQRAENDAENRGYDRAMNQAVKQQYWIIQEQQRSGKTTEVRPTMMPVTVPETTQDGVIRKASIAFVPVGS